MGGIRVFRSPDIKKTWQKSTLKVMGCSELNGGSAWESNPPGKFLTPHTGFEDRAAHQRPTRFHNRETWRVRKNHFLQPRKGHRILSEQLSLCNHLCSLPDLSLYG